MKTIFPIGKYSYQDSHVVFSVNAPIFIQTGKVIVLSAKNGSGKSTAMRFIYQNNPSVYLPEELNFPGHLTANKIVDLFGSESKDENIAEALNRLSFENRAFDLLSKGNKQKLKIAVTLRSAFSNKNESLILLDEPGSGLDSTSLAVLKEIISDLAEKNPHKVFVIVAHENWSDLKNSLKLTIQDRVLKEIA